MTPEEKLEKVEELLAARDEITVELLELMGAEVDEEIEEDEAPLPKRQVSKKAVATAKGCSECGSPSRHKGTCSKASSRASKPSMIGHGGSKAHASDEDDKEPMGTVSSGRTILDEPLRLDEQQYDDVMASIGDGLPLESIGYSYPDIELNEIRKASRSESFDDYLAS